MSTSQRLNLAELAARIGQEPTLSIAELALLETRLDDETEALAAFIDPTSPPDLRRSRAALVVQLMSRDEQLIEEYGIAQKKRLLSFLDGSLSRNYRAWDIDLASQDFQRIKALAFLPRQAEQAVESAVDQLVSLDVIDVGRNAVQRALSVYRPVLSPLVPETLLKAKVSELFETIRNLNFSQGPSFLATHARATELLREFASEVADAGPIAERSLSGLVERLKHLVADAYEASPATDPADLLLTAIPKRYPLGADAVEVRLGVSIRNAGPGQALDARLDNLDAVGVELSTNTVPLGQLMPGTVSGTISATSIGSSDGCAIVEGTLRWQDSDGSNHAVPFECVFEAQRTDVPWERLRQRYDLDPVNKVSDLVGRAEVLRNLTDLVGPRRVGSAFITGQKRVGKTSIALTLQDTLRAESDVIVVHLDAGLFVQASIDKTVEAMGTAIVEELGAADERFADIEMPDFGQTIAPIKRFVGQMRTRAPRLRVMIVVDEFDVLPIEMYRRGPEGDAFFAALRALTSQEHIGFLLVGGERMARIIDAQGTQLNKFETVVVTYFDRERHWDDFADLVRVPVRDCFEVTDAAIVRLFQFTAGHPFFTKLICRALFSLAVRRRDAHLTEVEVLSAVDEALAAASTPNFAHFWEDGVLEVAEKREEVSVRRRQFLVAYAECIEAGERASSAVIERAGELGLPGDQASELMREFVRRGVLIDDVGNLRAKVELFDQWLARSGVSAITTTFTDPDAILNAKRREREEYVDSEEITELVAQWGTYRGRPITAEDVRAWLNQFETVRHQRLMFTVLTTVRFYDASLVRSKLKEAHGIVRRGLVQRLEARKLKRDEIVVSYLGEVAKSGAHYARLYADENQIYAGCVVEPRNLDGVLRAEEVQALVLVDDMLGSGDQACEFLELLERQIGVVVRRRKLKVVFVVLAGFVTAQERLRALVEAIDFPAEIHVCDPLGPEDHCFGSQANIFADVADREEARGVAESYGKRLKRRYPLGYRGAEATIVFDESCPNGTLPILWDGKADVWRPLFPRYRGG